MSAPVRILTFKRGLLARLAHDLQLSLTRVEVVRDGPRVRARLDVRALAVDGVVRDGVLRPDVLSPRDVRDVLENTARDVLDSRRFPELRFDGTAEARGAGVRVSGALEIRGRRAPVTFDLTVRDGLATGDVELVPSRWGIEPFTALLGAMAVQDRVVVRLAIPVEDPAGP